MAKHYSLYNVCDEFVASVFTVNFQVAVMVFSMHELFVHTVNILNSAFLTIFHVAVHHIVRHCEVACFCI